MHFIFIYSSIVMQGRKEEKNGKGETDLTRNILLPARMVGIEEMVGNKKFNIFLRTKGL